MRRGVKQCSHFFERAKFYKKKRAKNGHFFSKKTGKKRAKLKNVMKKNGRFRVFLYPLS